MKINKKSADESLKIKTKRLASQGVQIKRKGRCYIMSITKKSINNNEYMFFNHSRSNHSGFVHETELYKNDRLIGEYKIQYYNRTWECYQFQSVMRGVINSLIAEAKEEYKNAYKKAHNIKRLTEAKRAEMQTEFEKDTFVNELENLYQML